MLDKTYSRHRLCSTKPIPGIRYVGENHRSLKLFLIFVLVVLSVSFGHIDNTCTNKKLQAPVDKTTYGT